jgi:hypothetical protein
MQSTFYNSVLCTQFAHDRSYLPLAHRHKCSRIRKHYYVFVVCYCNALKEPSSLTKRSACHFLNNWLPGDRLPGDRLPGDRLPGDRLPGDQLPSA